MSARSIGLRHLVALRPRHGRGRNHRPVARRRAARPSPPSRAGSSPLRRNGRAGSRSSPRSRACTKSTMRFHAASCSGAYMPGAAGRDAPLRADAGHLDIDEPGAALGALGVVDEVPVGRAAVHGLVLVHRRDDDAVLEPHIAQRDRARTSAAATIFAGAPARRWNHASAPSSQALSRSRRFSWLMRCERVSSE